MDASLSLFIACRVFESWNSYIIFCEREELITAWIRKECYSSHSSFEWLHTNTGKQRVANANPSLQRIERAEKKITRITARAGMKCRCELTLQYSEWILRVGSHDKNAKHCSRSPPGVIGYGCVRARSGHGIQTSGSTAYHVGYQGWQWAIGEMLNWPSSLNTNSVVWI